MSFDELVHEQKRRQAVIAEQQGHIKSLSETKPEPTPGPTPADKKTDNGKIDNGKKVFTKISNKA